MGVFDNIDVQNLEVCSNEDFFSGVQTRLYYAPASFFFKIPVPVPDVDLDSEIIIDSEILLRTGKKLCHIDILIDENELKINPIGNAGKKKIKSGIDFYILGFRPSIIGFLLRCINEPLIFFIKDANGNNWQIGTALNRAFIENFEGSSGKKMEDNSGVMITITCNSPLFIYKNSLDHLARPGDFNNDFNNDFSHIIK